MSDVVVVVVSSVCLASGLIVNCPMLALYRPGPYRVLQTSIRLIAFCLFALTVNCPMLLLFRLCASRVLQKPIRLMAFCASALTVNCPMLLLLRLCFFSRAAKTDSVNSLLCVCSDCRLSDVVVDSSFCLSCVAKHRFG